MSRFASRIRRAKHAPSRPGVLPSDLTELVLWLKADEITGLADGAKVTTWPDSSGGNHPATESNADRQPLYVQNIANGKPVVRFNAANDTQLVSGASSSYAQQTIFAVIKPTALTGDQTIRGGGIGGGSLQLRLAGNKLNLVQQSVAEIGTATTALTGTAFQVAACTFAAGSGYAFWVDGQLAGSGATTVTNLTANEASTIGHHGSYGELFTGDIAEIVCYSRVLTSAEIDDISAYLYTKWIGASTQSDTIAPTVPINLTATPAATSIALSWTASSDNVGVVGYEYSLDGTTYTNTGSTATTYTVSGLAEATSYTVHLRAYDAAGNRGTAATATATTITSGGPSGALNLPRIAWEGGSAYWAQFSKPTAAGWTSPSFFPIVSYSNSFSGDSEIAWDKSLGINTYYGLNEWSPWNLLATHQMSYIGEPYQYVNDTTPMPSDFVYHVAHNYPDEIDGTSATGPDGINAISQLCAQYRALNDGRFISANYTQMCVMDSWPYKDHFVNGYTDQVSLDMYWYTIPQSSIMQFDSSAYVSAVDLPLTHRPSSACYGSLVRGLRQVDDYTTHDTKKQPVWFVIEALSGSPGEEFVRYISPGEAKGAAMNCVINEARGIVWFNNVASNTHAVGNVFRQAQVQGSGFVGWDQVMAVKEINLLIQSLAPILNTQSYQWTFGSGLDTMLKDANGFAYIFAMIDNKTTPGSRTFALPPVITGTSIEVLNESRTINVSGGQFTDTFQYEYSYHIYKIAI